MRNIQIINNNKGQPAYVVIPHSQWEAMREALDDAADAVLADKLAADFKKSGHKGYPSELMKKLLEPGASSLKIIREWRGLTQQKLADLVGFDRVYIANIERGARSAGLKLKKALVKALNVHMEILFPEK